MSKDTENLTPVVPDPFWPEGAVPTHLSPVEKRGAAGAYSQSLGTWHCEKCGTTVGKSIQNEKLCGNCYVLETKNSAVAKKTNADWMEQSNQIGLALYERQPEENDLEWYIWTTYRQHYPMRMPTYSELAKEVNSSTATVLKAANRWSFKVRLQAWARRTDDVMLQDRIDAIKEMNSRQLTMAQTLQQKLKTAIDILDPTLLRPNEIVSLLKASTELDRKITLSVPEKVEGTMIDAGTKQQQLTKAEDITEVVSILQRAGVLDGKSIGVEQTTRVIVKEDQQ